jgi:RNA polymerase sigma-70 factor (ECF subfamily)
MKTFENKQEISNIIDKIRMSDIESYNTFFKMFYKPVCVYINEIILDFESSRDISQDIFHKLWVNRKSFPQCDNYELYLFKIAKNKAFDFLKSKNVKNKYSNFILKMNKEESQPIDNLEVQELEKMLESNFESFLESTKQIYLLKKDKQLTNKQISEIVAIPKKTIDWHVSKINASIKKIINNYLGS